LVQERDIKDRWKKYFHSLLNEGYEISPASNMLDIREEDQNNKKMSDEWRRSILIPLYKNKRIFKIARIIEELKY